MSARDDQARAAAAMLIAARGEGTRVAAFPEGLAPASLEEALAVQDALLAALGQPVAGYKLGGTTLGARQAFGTEEVFFGALTADVLLPSPATLPADDFYQPGVEPEITFRMGQAVPPRPEPYAPEEVAACVEAALLSIEVPNSCLVNAVELGLPALVADNAGYGVLILGDEVESWQGRVDDVAVRVTAGGATVSQGSTADVTGGPLAGLTAFVNRLSGLGRTLEAGQVVCTGGCGPYIVVPLDVPVVAEFEGLGRVELTFQGEG